MKINGNIVSCAGNFALRARCKWRGELRAPRSLQVARGTSLNVRYGGIASPYEMENSIQPHYPLENTH